MFTLAELRKKDIKDLQPELEKARETLLAAQLSVRMKQDKKSNVITNNKRYIAQILMIMNEMRRASAEAEMAKMEATA